jgi:hypothetical protein
MQGVFLTNGCEFLRVIEPVVAIRQSDTVLPDISETVVGVGRIRVDEEIDRNRDAGGQRSSEPLDDVIVILQRFDCGQFVQQRFCSQLLRAVLVGEAVEQVCDLLGVGAGRPVGRCRDFLDQFAQLLLLLPRPTP